MVETIQIHIQKQKIEAKGLLSAVQRFLSISYKKAHTNTKTYTITNTNTNTNANAMQKQSSEAEGGAIGGRSFISSTLVTNTTAEKIKSSCCH